MDKLEGGGYSEWTVAGLILEMRACPTIWYKREY